MKLDAKVKGGLAWAGLVVILAVPAADILMGRSDGNATSAAMTTAPAAKPALKAPALKADPIVTASTGTDPVDKFVSAGKKLPAYISDGDQVGAPKPPALKPVVAPTQTASLPAAEITPPIPLPRDARPKATSVAALPASQKPVIVDEDELAQREAAIDRFPLSDGGDGRVVTRDQLEEWDSGSLADYLARKGLLTESETRRQTSEEYDPDGFFLDEGPNRPRRSRNDDFDFFLF